ncbi:hypothetical protein V6U81_22850 [Micromonospora sp. CPCC 205711]|uniref:hypothetical protein n=1 Tax=Micromonospora sp. CPCC 205547 TaxID=3122400 RepID=UPI002FEE6C43
MDEPKDRFGVEPILRVRDGSHPLGAAMGLASSGDAVDKGNEALGSFRELRFFGPALLNLALELVAVEGLRRVRTKYAVAWFSCLTSGVNFGRLRRGAGVPWWR